MFFLAKVIQALGIADVGYALYVGLTEEHSMGRELLLMMLGFAMFLARSLHGAAGDGARVRAWRGAENDRRRAEVVQRGVPARRSACC